MPAVPRITLLALAVLPCACRGFEPPRPETLAAIRPMPLAPRLPGRFELEFVSPALTGTFDGVSAAVGKGFQLQLFPDVGGKVLDLAVDEGRLVHADTPGGPAEPRFAAVLAAMFAELHAAVSRERVRGERTSSDGATEVELAPAFAVGTVVARLSADGAITSYAFDQGAVEFEFRADGCLVGNGFSGQLRLPAPRTGGTP